MLSQQRGLAGSRVRCRTMSCLNKSVTSNAVGVNESGYENF